jgi:uncharacterized protein DUF1236
MSPTRKQLRVLATAAIVSLLSAGTIAVGQAQNQQQSPNVSSTLNLTMEQRHIIKEIIKDLKIENEPKNVRLRIGQVIPKTVQLRAMPLDISQKVSHVKNHVFFLKNNKVVLVDPKDNKVVDVIDLK